MKWRNGMLYSCRKIGRYPAVYIERSISGKYRGVIISLFKMKGKTGINIFLPIRLAKLVVKNINLALSENSS